MINKNSIIDAYIHIRKNDCTIPDDVLDFMKDAAISKLEAIDKAKGVMNDLIIQASINKIRSSMGVPLIYTGFDLAKEGGGRTEFIKQHLNKIEPPKRYLVTNKTSGNQYNCVIQINRHGQERMVGDNIDYSGSSLHYSMRALTENPEKWSIVEISNDKS